MVTSLVSLGGSMRDAISAIMERSRSIAQGLGTEAYLYEAPSSRNQVFPYLVMSPQTTHGPDVQTGGDVIEIIPSTANWYSLEADLAWDALHTIEKEFTQHPPVMKAGKCFGVFIGSSLVQPDPTTTEDGKDIWHGVLQITFHVQRSLIH